MSLQEYGEVSLWTRVQRTVMVFRARAQCEDWKRAIDVGLGVPLKDSHEEEA